MFRGQAGIQMQYFCPDRELSGGCGYKVSPSVFVRFRGKPVLPHLHLNVANDLSEIHRVIAALETFGEEHDIAPGPLAHVGLALDELLTNAISYGLDGTDGQTVVVDVMVADDAMVISIIDHAKPFNPLEIPPPDLTLDITDRPIGGLGIHLVRGMMDEVHYRREGDKNVLVLRKSLKPRAVPQ